MLQCYLLDLWNVTPDIKQLFWLLISFRVLFKILFFNLVAPSSGALFWMAKTCGAQISFFKKIYICQRLKFFCRKPQRNFNWSHTQKSFLQFRLNKVSIYSFHPHPQVFCPVLYPFLFWKAPFIFITYNRIHMEKKCRRKNAGETNSRWRQLNLKPLQWGRTTEFHLEQTLQAIFYPLWVMMTDSWPQ